MISYKPPPPQPRLPADEIPAVYDHWRWRHLYSTFIGYAIFYFVRQNIPAAMPLMEQEGISKEDLGKFLSFHGILYGLSKFLNGILGDRSNPRYFMATGLLLSGLTNLCFGFSNSVLVLGLWWVLNGWFQGMGFPPCARLLAHWFAAPERGRKWGLWNTSHQIGGAGILVFSGWLGQYFGWRYIFWVPGLIAIATCFFLINRLRDTPESLGLPPVEEWYEEHEGRSAAARRQEVAQAEGSAPIGAVHEAPSPPGTPPPEVSFATTLVNKVFTNKYIWFICVANFFVYVIRYAFFNWSITYLHQVKHVPLTDAGWMTASFEIAGLFGSLLAGWLADKALGGRRTPICLFYLGCTALSILAFWKSPLDSPALDALTLSLVGFFIYGPQFLVGVMTTDLASKEAAASAIGLTGFFGYAASVFYGYGLGWLVKNHGWDPTFQALIACCLAAAIPFSLCWKKT